MSNQCWHWINRSLVSNFMQFPLTYYFDIIYHIIHICINKVNPIFIKNYELYFFTYRMFLKDNRCVSSKKKNHFILVTYRLFYFSQRIGVRNYQSMLFFSFEEKEAYIHRLNCIFIFLFFHQTNLDIFNLYDFLHWK